ncbi:MAG: NAD-dependent epimerase/dehydratase family protein [Bacillota bacterium]
MDALVIGGSRFVGLRLVWELARRGHRVTILNRGRTAALLPGETRRLTCDRHDHKALVTCLEGRNFDAVFDITAYTPEDSSGLVQAISGRAGRLVHVSTGSVYRFFHRFPWDEDTPLVDGPEAGEYGWLKRQCEDILWEAHAQGLPVSVVRPGYVYGPHNSIYREALFFDRLVRDLPVLVPGDGSYLVQFGHVDDLARLLVLCAEHPEAPGKAFNFAGSRACTANDYVEDLFAACRARTRIIHFDPVSLNLTPQEVGQVWPYRYLVHTLRDISRARYVLGYQERYSLREGLRDTFEWWRQSGQQRNTVDTSVDRLVGG